VCVYVAAIEFATAARNCSRVDELEELLGDCELKYNATDVCG